MVEPRQGDRAHGRGIVKVLAGPKALVFGIRCEDPEAAGIVSFTKERDGDFEAEDHVVVVLDPFQDGRSGYVFAVNPGGARFDALVQPGGEDVDKNWDGEWEAGTARDAGGWTAEIRIPIETLSFKRDLGNGASTSSGASSGCRRRTAGRARGRTTRSSRRARRACSPGFPASTSAWASACGPRSSAASRTRPRTPRPTARSSRAWT